MKTYTAISGRDRRGGGLHGCLAWAQDLVADSPDRIVKIHRLRPKERNAPVIAEVTRQGCRWIDGRRVVRAKKAGR